MIFDCDGCGYDTADMLEFRTGNPAIRALYVTRESPHRAFVERVDEAGRAKVERISASETRYLADHFFLHELVHLHPHIADTGDADFTNP